MELVIPQFSTTCSTVRPPIATFNKVRAASTTSLNASKTTIKIKVNAVNAITAGLV